MAPHFLSGKHIVVAGAGPAGLAFALNLRKLWPDSLPPPRVTIFERDARQDAAGREGYSMSVSGTEETGGLVTLDRLGLLDAVLGRAVLKLDGQGGGAFCVWNAKWEVLATIRPKPFLGLPVSAIRIRRKDLRQVLIDAIPPEEVRWGIACTAAEKLPEGRMRVRLAGEGLSEEEAAAGVECDLLIAADGASSKIRTSLRPDDTLQHAGAVQLGGNSVFPGGIPKPLDENWGMIFSAKGVSCFVSPCDKTSVIWGMSFASDEEPGRMDREDPAQVQAVLDDGKRLGSVFAPPFQSIVEATDPQTMFRSSAKDKAPFSHDLAAGQVVYIGDSNHAVSPFAGYGVNLALKDGWDLADQLCKARSLEAAVKAYDALSVRRAAKIRKVSHSRINMAHSSGLKYLYWNGMARVLGVVMGLMGRT